MAPRHEGGWYGRPSVPRFSFARVLQIPQPRAAGLHLLSPFFVSFGCGGLGCGRRPRPGRLCGGGVTGKSRQGRANRAKRTQFLPPVRRPSPPGTKNAKQTQFEELRVPSLKCQAASLYPKPTIYSIIPRFQRGSVPRSGKTCETNPILARPGRNRGQNVQNEPNFRRRRKKSGGDAQPTKSRQDRMCETNPICTRGKGSVGQAPPYRSAKPIQIGPAGPSSGAKCAKRTQFPGPEWPAAWAERAKRSQFGEGRMDAKSITEKEL